MLIKRILIVDDSVVIRRSLSDALARERDLSVAGSAASGRIALMKMPLLKPDVVLLDINLPGKDAMETLAALRADYPATVVVILTVAARRGAADTIDALSLGAKACVMKPEVAARSDARLQLLCAEVVSLMASWPSVGSHAPAAAVKALPQAAVPHRLDVVAIGVSTGGPTALMDLLPGLASDFPVPIVIVQHMPPVFTRLLAQRLAAKCRIRVAEGRPGQVLRPGDALIAPGDFHMEVEREGAAVVVRTHQSSRENSCRPSVDVLFRSVAQTYGPHALAVVMTGMGRDGVNGCQDIRAAGGQTVVQDEASSVVWGMPGLVVKAELADQVVPLSALADVITDRVSRHRWKQGDLVGR